MNDLLEKTQTRNARAQRRDHEATEEQMNCDLADLRKKVKVTVAPS